MNLVETALRLASFLGPIPTAVKLRDEIRKFVDWFEKDRSTNLVLKAGSHMSGS